LQREAALLDAMLQRFHIPVAGGTTLFRYVEIADAADLFAWLGGYGILVRNFSWSTTALRFGLPGSEAEWLRLERALQSWAARGSHAKKVITL
jgi:cobalamin biosynthetic protein CobC